MRRKRTPAFEALEDRLCLSYTLPPPTTIILPTTGAWTGSDPFYGSPIFADLKGDGNQELLVEEAGGTLAAYQPSSTAAGQYTLYKTYTIPPMANGQIGNLQATPVVVNVPNLGPVIVAALGRDETANTVNDGRVVAFNARTGALLWGMSTALPAGSSYTQTGVTGALTIGYLEGNGQPDVIVDSFSHLVSAINVATGKVLWQYNNDDTVEAGAVVADLYGDNKQEVIYASGISPSSYYPAGGYITILNQDGSLLRRIYVPGAIFGSPVVADLFGNGQKEIVVAPNDYFNRPESGWNPTAAQEAAFQAAANRVYAFYPNGATVPGWPYHTTSNDAQDAATWKEPIAADLYGNGQNEILDIDRLGVLHVIKATPTGPVDAPGFVGGKALGGGTDTFASPIVAPIDGTGQQDVVVADGYMIQAYAPNGTQIFSTTTPFASNGIPNLVDNAAAYGRFTPNGTPVLAVASASGNVGNQPLSVQIFALPNTTTAAAWPMLRKTSTGQAVALSMTAETGIVKRTYDALFFRDPTSGPNSELSYYVPLLMSGAISPFDLAAKLAKSPEGMQYFPGPLGNSTQDTINKAAKVYNAPGIATANIPADSLAAILYDAHRGRTWDDMAILVVGDDGNYAATNSVAPWAASIYRDIFGVQPSTAQIASVVTALDRGEAMGDVVKGLLTSPNARKAFVGALAHNYESYNTFVVNCLYQLLPTSAAGVLRTLNLSSSIPTNPNPALVTAYTNLLIAGTSQEVVLASMMTNPQYISNSTYSRGVYVSPGIRE